MAVKSFGALGMNGAQKQSGGSGGARGGVEEIFFQNDAVSLCLLVNRRARIMRVVDFRAGPSEAKRLFVLTLAQREGVEKAYTLVERDEVQTWTKLGFAKEANIPGFYKRSDAFLMGCPVPPPSATAGKAKAIAAPSPDRSQRVRDGRDRDDRDDRDGDDLVAQSETRLTAAEPVGGPVPLSPAHQRMERTLVLAKRSAKESAARALPAAKIAALTEADARKAVASALKSGRALTAFEAFGRDVVRRYFVATAKGGFALTMSIESQACFGNAFIELLQAPKSDAEKVATTSAVRAMCEKLQGEEVVSCFALAPSDDVVMATVFVQNGFRRTGLLLDHVVTGPAGTQRKDAILWSRKLANPAED
jgi:hypothetical protein